jgi:hypothetical protein
MTQRLRVIVATFSSICALALAPPVFNALFAMAPVTAPDGNVLWALAVALMGLGLILARWGGSRSLAFLLALTVLLAAELSTRAFVRVAFMVEQRQEIDKMLQTWRGENWQYAPHPFLQHIGNPLYHFPSDPRYPEVELDKRTPYNALGFRGTERGYSKPEETTRIACLGGSTTEGGWPEEMEQWLNTSATPPTRFEALNFGLGGWGTAHSLVNYVLNVVDFDPDVVVIHHAWNDFSALQPGSALRGDYMHLQMEQSGEVGRPTFERVPGVSVIYRLLRHRGQPHMMRLPEVRLEAGSLLGGGDMAVPWPYRRNIETIIDLARLHDRKVLLTTQPHTSQHGNEPDVLNAQFIDACNEVVRDIHRQRSDPGVVLVDLARALPPQSDGFFMDLAHMHQDGRRWKGEQIGAGVLRLAAEPEPDDSAARGPDDGSPPPVEAAAPM